MPVGVFRRLALVAAVALLVSGGCDRVFGIAAIEPSCEIESCSRAGGTCGAAGTCEMFCVSSPCECPAGNSCQLDVMFESGIVDCSRAEDCQVRCLGTGGVGYCRDTLVRCGSGNCSVSCISAQLSCLGISLVCGTGPCSLACAHNGSCQDASSVSCGQSSMCSVSCQVDACASLAVACEQATSCTATCASNGNNTCNGASFMCQQAIECDLDCAGQPDCTM